MTAQFARAPQRGRGAPGLGSQEPHAALLIDFDNVTMGIRSDLTKELKNLLNSDIIKGKVAVQRAYADWRRYPQYIVPLAESSVDLIFAPAYGSAKKNATDIRLAIDAVELVFTRPEIGTIILLSGDSDFSSLVLKLKEYGKYVIGVGIRESASDLLVQNCDEYYSYSALTGLTRAGDETQVVSEDPWELVEVALRQMRENDDVMRSDRLKQVLLELDPNFDEKSLGFQKFNKFLQEAATRGLLSLRKQDNGQFEIGPPEEQPAAGVEAEPREGRRGRGRRGRGRREDGRERREAEPEPAAVQAEAPAEEELAPEPTPEKVEAPAPEPAVAAAPPAEHPVRTGPALNAAYDLVRRAASDLVKKSGQPARDSDVKRRMLELEPGWDESGLGFSKFSRFLRQAHDAEVITLRRGDNGVYDVTPGADGGVEEPPRPRERGRGRGRDRRDTTPRPAAEPAAERAAERAAEPAAEPAAERAAPAAAKPSARPERTAARAEPAAEAPAPAATAPAAAAAKPSAAPSGRPAPAPAAAVGFRRGSRGRAAPSGPPPLLEGQAAHVKPATAAAPQRTAERAEPVAPETPAPSAAPAPFSAAALGLPQDAGAVANYIANQYKGVGPKSVQALIEAFGPGRVFDALETQPDRVREILPGARGERLLQAWSEDVGRRREAAAAAEPAAPAATGGRAAAKEGRPAAKSARKTSRKTARRSGSGSGRTTAKQTAQNGGATEAAQAGKEKPAESGSSSRGRRGGRKGGARRATARAGAKSAKE